MSTRARTGLLGRASPIGDRLRGGISPVDELHEAHLRAFTFDNIDILLDQHRGVGLDAVQEKFVGRGRGGYCFEHAVLFAAALERLGYDVQQRLGRVGDRARTHTVGVDEVRALLHRMEVPLTPDEESRLLQRVIDLRAAEAGEPRAEPHPTPARSAT